MKTSSQHIPFGRLADLSEDRASTDERREAMAHISDCSHCATELQRLGTVLELMRTDTTADAPRDVLANAINIFRGRNSKPSLLRRIVATLSFDSSQNLAPAFGVRSGQTTSRQLLYSAQDSDIDLRISHQEDQWTVAGQLLGQDCIGGRVEMEGESGLVAGALNELCEFALPPVAAGSYTLRLFLHNAEIEIPRFELRA
jgi:hypothetical protein